MITPRLAGLHLLASRKWSWNNQLITALQGHSDARGYRQWQTVGRQVKKGQRSFVILSPVMKTMRDKKTGEDRMVVVAFKGTAVFGHSQTDGESLPDLNPELTTWVDRLPVIDVAREWGITVDTFNGENARYYGYFKFSEDAHGIALGVENLSAWAREMIHAADKRLGNLTERGQHWRSETVAELGGATLLNVLGFDHDADLGGCWEYVTAYAKDAELEPITACQRILKQMCNAVAMILDTADELKAVKVI